MKKLKMIKNYTPGLLITFCGLDGCGKTTMIKMLTNELSEQGKRVIVTKQPTDFVRNSDIFRNYIDETDHTNYDYRSMSLFAASDRLQHVNKVILPELMSGNTVICDRYYYSCLANLISRQYTQDKWIYEIAEHIIKPDLSFFLDVPVSTSLSRIKQRPHEANRFIDIPLQYRLKKAYVEICNNNDGVLIMSENDVQTTYKKIRLYTNRIMEKKYGNNK